jgi:hypothetical protein
MEEIELPTETTPRFVKQQRNDLITYTKEIVAENSKKLGVEANLMCRLAMTLKRALEVVDGIRIPQLYEIYQMWPLDNEIPVPSNIQVGDSVLIDLNQEQQNTPSHVSGLIINKIHASGKYIVWANHQEVNGRLVNGNLLVVSEEYLTRN